MANYNMYIHQQDAQNVMKSKVQRSAPTDM